jgi:hypothetical protein
LYAIFPRRSSDILRRLRYGIGIEVDGYDVGLAALGCHQGYEPSTSTHIQYTPAMLYPRPDTE